MKKFLLTLIAIILITSTVNAGVSVQLNGQNIDFTDENGNKVDAQIVNSRTMVPMRKIFELLGAEINWEGTTKTVSATKDDTTIKLQIDNEIAEITKEGKTEKITLDSKPILINNRTMVPLRFISESLEKQVGWDSANETAIIIDYDYFENKLKEKSSAIYNAITTMPTTNSTIQITRKYEDLLNSANNTSSTIYATVSQNTRNKQSLLIDFNGNSELFNEIKNEGWGTVALELTYDDEGVSYNTSTEILNKMLSDNRKTYEQMNLNGKYNSTLADGFRAIFGVKDNALNIHTFNNIKNEYDKFINLFSFTNVNGVSTMKLNTLNYTNGNNKYFDYTKFDNIIIENEFMQVYNIINKLIFNYDIKLDELLYDTSNINIELATSNQNNESVTTLKIIASNEYNEKITYDIKVNKK